MHTHTLVYLKGENKPDSVYIRGQKWMRKMMMMMKKKKREKRYSAALLIARANLVENLANAPMRATNSAMMLLLKLMQPPPVFYSQFQFSHFCC